MIRVSLMAIFIAGSLWLSGGPAYAQARFDPGAPIAPLAVDYAPVSESPVVPAGFDAAGGDGVRPAGHAMPVSQIDVDEHRSQRMQQLKQSLAAESESTRQQRDDLTLEVFNVLKWTSVIIMLGTVASIALKQFGKTNWRSGGPAASMKVVETLPFGRRSGLHLVAVGQERLVVAADATGIKSVTLLPSWPGIDGDEEAPAPGNDPTRKITPAGTR